LDLREWDAIPIHRFRDPDSFTQTCSVTGGTSDEGE
jgi:hypothetical protein